MSARMISHGAPMKRTRGGCECDGFEPSGCGKGGEMLVEEDEGAEEEDVFGVGAGYGFHDVTEGHDGGVGLKRADLRMEDG